jgi:plastocyanin
VEKTLFYIFGATLVVSAVGVALVGLRKPQFPPSGAVLGAVIAYFALMVGATTTFAVLNAAKEQRDRNAEQAAATSTTTSTTSTSTTTPTKAGPPVKLAAQASQIAYDTTKLSAKAGSVTINFNNPSAVGHDVCVETSSGSQVGCSSIITQSSTTLQATLQPGSYTFYCSVDSHRAAGMQGTLTVK